MEQHEQPNSFNSGVCQTTPNDAQPPRPGSKMPSCDMKSVHLLPATDYPPQQGFQTPSQNSYYSGFGQLGQYSVPLPHQIVEPPPSSVYPPQQGPQTPHQDPCCPYFGHSTQYMIQPPSYGFHHSPSNSNNG